MLRPRYLVFGALFGLVAMIAAPAQATDYDLRSPGATALFDGWHFTQNYVKPASFGQVTTVLAIHRNGEEEGINSIDPVLDDQPQRAQLYVHDLFMVDDGGVLSVPFLVNINQTGSSPQLSLDQLAVFASSNANPASLGQLQTEGHLIAAFGSDTHVLLNYNANKQGAAAADAYGFLPAALFAGYDDQFVVIYMKMGGKGGDFAANDGTDFLAQVSDPAVPVSEPASAILVGLGLMGLALKRRHA